MGRKFVRKGAIYLDELVYKLQDFFVRRKTIWLKTNSCRFLIWRFVEQLVFISTDFSGENLQRCQRLWFHQRSWPSTGEAVIFAWVCLRWFFIFPLNKKLILQLIHWCGYKVAWCRNVNVNFCTHNMSKTLWPCVVRLQHTKFTLLQYIALISRLGNTWLNWRTERKFTLGASPPQQIERPKFSWRCNIMLWPTHDNQVTWQNHGVTWTELAISFMLFTGFYLPFLRDDSDGVKRIQIGKITGCLRLSPVGTRLQLCHPLLPGTRYKG